MKYQRTIRVSLLIFICFIGFDKAESLDLDSTYQLFHFHGTDSESNIGSVIQSLGDVNNDGYDDIAFNSFIPLGIYIFLGGNQPDTVFDYFLDNVTVIGKVFDYNGDGLRNLIASNDSIIYIYGIYDDTVNTFPIDSLIIDSGMVQFKIMDSHDINNNGIADILVRDKNPYEGERIHLYLDPFTGDKLIDWSHSITDYLHLINSGAFIDFNSDGFDDIMICKTARLDSVSYIYIFYGPTFQQNPEIIIGHPSEYNDTLDKKYFALESFNIGDVNGDGFDDLGVMSAPDVPRNTIYLGGPSADTLQDFWLDKSGLHMSNIGDINNDGFNDIAIGGEETFAGQVIIYLGGPSFDSEWDDLIGQNDLPPLFLYRIGDPVTSAGDINGDGIDDILFHTTMAAGGYYGHVFVFSGDTNLIVDIDDQGHYQLNPSGLHLHQNYPNPFNSSTQIEYSLPSKSDVTLTIFNILGQRIYSTEISNQSAGTHLFSWDGRNSGGTTISSGIYFYQIKTSDFSDIKKMVLLK